MPRKLSQEIIINSDQQSTFNALIKPSMINQWWFAKTSIVVPEKGGIYMMCWGEDIDDPDYISQARIEEINAPTSLTLRYVDYRAKMGKLPFEADFMVYFQLESSDDKQTKLSVRQEGFPNEAIADEYYNGCIKGWDDTLQSIKTVLEL